MSRPKQHFPGTSTAIAEEIAAVVDSQTPLFDDAQQAKFQALLQTLLSLRELSLRPDVTQEQLREAFAAGLSLNNCPNSADAIRQRIFELCIAAANAGRKNV
jgi:hypothetical protein